MENASQVAPSSMSEFEVVTRYDQLSLSDTIAELSYLFSPTVRISLKRQFSLPAGKYSPLPFVVQVQATIAGRRPMFIDQ